jgi:sugar phosphate isomerase/epimerase
VKIAYAFRANRFYPFNGRGVGNELPPAEHRAAYLRRVREMGVDGLELGIESFGGPERVTETSARALARELADAGTPVACIRGGGGFASARAALASRGRIEANIRLAAWTGANLVNTTVSVGYRDTRQPGTLTGEPVSQGSSRMATAEDFERTARELATLGDMAAELGVTISIEIHQHSIVDNSWSALHLHKLINKPNVGINPDLGNIYWTYDIPEETSEAAIVALAPHAKYWHCKNLYRVYLPHDQRAVFLYAPLPDGDIDYRFAIAAMKEAGYDGYLAVEGIRHGDQLSKDARSVQYVRSILAELGEG